MLLTNVQDFVLSTTRFPIRPNITLIARCGDRISDSYFVSRQVMEPELPGCHDKIYPCRIIPGMCLRIRRDHRGVDLEDMDGAIQKSASDIKANPEVKKRDTQFNHKITKRYHRYLILCNFLLFLENTETKQQENLPSLEDLDALFFFYVLRDLGICLSNSTLRERIIEDYLQNSTYKRKTLCDTVILEGNVSNGCYLFNMFMEYFGFFLTLDCNSVPIYKTKMNGAFRPNSKVLGALNNMPKVKVEDDNRMLSHCLSYNGVKLFDFLEFLGHMLSDIKLREITIYQEGCLVCEIKQLKYNPVLILFRKLPVHFLMMFLKSKDSRDSVLYLDITHSFLDCNLIEYVNYMIECGIRVIVRTVTSTKSKQDDKKELEFRKESLISVEVNIKDKRNKDKRQLGTCYLSFSSNDLGEAVSEFGWSRVLMMIMKGHLTGIEFLGAEPGLFTATTPMEPVLYLNSNLNVMNCIADILNMRIFALKLEVEEKEDEKYRYLISIAKPDINAFKRELEIRTASPISPYILKQMHTFRMNQLTVNHHVSSQEEGSDILKRLLTGLVNFNRHLFLKKLHLGLMITEVVDTVYISKLMEYEQGHVDLLNSLLDAGCEITVEASNVRRKTDSKYFCIYKPTPLNLTTRMLLFLQQVFPNY